MKFLATPAAAAAWAKKGGFATGNKNMPASVYPDATTRATASAIAKAKNVAFDMSDQQPASFGATVGQGEWGLFQDFLRNPTDVKGIQSKLESSAASAYKKARVALELGQHHGGAAAVAAAPAADPAGARLRRYVTGTLFLLPALDPARRSGWSTRSSTRSSAASTGAPGSTTSSGSTTTRRSSRRSTLTTAIKNNLIWVAVVPAFVTALGLIFAVLTERVSWSVAFKTVVFLPDGDLRVRDRRHLADHVRAGPESRRGQRARALGRTRSSSPPGVALGRRAVDARASTGSAQTGMVLKTPLHPGGVALLGLTAIPPEQRADGRRRRRCSRSRCRATSPASSGATSSRAAACPGRSRRASSACPASPCSCGTPRTRW